MVPVRMTTSSVLVVSTSVEGRASGSHWPSKTRTLSSRNCCAASVPESAGGAPVRLALVDVIGPWVKATRSWATPGLAWRTATVSAPDVMYGDSPDRAGSSRVSGPGQKRSIRSYAASGIEEARSCRSFLVWMSSRAGRSGGRPFKANSASSASSLRGSTPRP